MKEAVDPFNRYFLNMQWLTQYFLLIWSCYMQSFLPLLFGDDKGMYFNACISSFTGTVTCLLYTSDAADE